MSVKNVPKPATVPGESALSNLESKKVTISVASDEYSSSNLHHVKTIKPVESPSPTVLPQKVDTSIPHKKPIHSPNSTVQKKPVDRAAPFNVKSRCSTTKCGDIESNPFDETVESDEFTFFKNHAASKFTINITICMWPVLLVFYFFVKEPFEYKCVYIIWVIFIILELFFMALQKYYLGRLNKAGLLLLGRTITNSMILFLLYFIVEDRVLVGFWFKVFVVLYTINNSLVPSIPLNLLWTIVPSLLTFSFLGVIGLVCC